jgi:hypothetical protein
MAVTAKVCRDFHLGEGVYVRTKRTYVIVARYEDMCLRHKVNGTTFPTNIWLILSDKLRKLMQLHMDITHVISCREGHCDDDNQMVELECNECKPFEYL